MSGGWAYFFAVSITKQVYRAVGLQALPLQADRRGRGLRYPLWTTCWNETLLNQVCIPVISSSHSTR